MAATTLNLDYRQKNSCRQFLYRFQRQDEILDKPEYGTVPAVVRRRYKVDIIRIYIYNETDLWRSYISLRDAAVKRQIQKVENKSFVKKIKIVWFALARSWAIPQDASKPVDGKENKGKERSNEEDSRGRRRRDAEFRFVL
jgi:hypothetical protein